VELFTQVMHVVIVLMWRPGGS